MFQARLLNGALTNLNTFDGKVLLVVNSASQCGFAKQMNDLQKLYLSYHEKGLEVLAFPCAQFMNQEEDSNEKIRETCDLKFRPSFPVFEKIDVNGEHTHPFFQYLKSKAPGFLGTKWIKWNFTKFLLNKDRSKIIRYSPYTNPLTLQSRIVQFLNE